MNDRVARFFVVVLVAPLLIACGGDDSEDAQDTGPGSVADDTEAVPEGLDRDAVAQCMSDAGIEVVTESGVLMSGAEAIAVPGQGVLGMEPQGSASAVVFVYATEEEAESAATSLASFMGTQSDVQIRGTAMLEYSSAPQEVKDAIDACVPAS